MFITQQLMGFSSICVLTLNLQQIPSTSLIIYLNLHFHVVTDLGLHYKIADLNKYNWQLCLTSNITTQITL